MIRRALTQADITACYLIRTRVFVMEQQVDPSLELDDDDQTALHFIVEDHGIAIATCRVLVHDNEAKVGRFAVISSHRHQGIGAQLLHFTEQTVLQDYPTLIRFYLGAQTHALHFYAKCGYTAYGELFDDAGIPHRMMEKRLQK